MVTRMSSLRTSFEAVRSELELAKRKKQAIDELLAKNRVSQPTYEHLVGGLNENITELETHQRTLVQKMTDRSAELESQAELIKLFFAILEMRNAAKEVNQETYDRNKQALELGLEATEKELSEIKDALAKTS
jgi:chromosome segregation ATPase